MRNEEILATKRSERRLAAVTVAPSLQLEIANEIVRVNKELFGRGPTKARVTIHADLVVCVLGNCLTPAERSLVKSGRSEAVAALRDEMHSIARSKLVRIVENATGRAVTAITSGIDALADQQVITFTVDAPIRRDQEIPAGHGGDRDGRPRPDGTRQ